MTGDAAQPCVRYRDCAVGASCDVSTGACTTSCDSSRPCNGACCDGATCRLGTTSDACGAAGSACVDCSADAQGHACLSAGTCGCILPTDCAPTATCANGACVPCAADEIVCDNTCVASLIDPDHCGGCETKCSGLVGRGCSAGVCLATCDDGAKNGDETAVDCGGTSCGPCSPGSTCSLPVDCTSKQCVQGVCDCENGLGFPGPPLWPLADGDATSIAIGDIDGDAVSDLVVAAGYTNQSGGFASVLLNRNHRFDTRIDLTAGKAPRGVALGDLDGDGKLDLAVASEGSDTFSVLLNKGNGAFAPAVDYAACNAPWSVSVSDFNMDGEPDVAVACWLADNIAVALNKGGGAFSPSVPYAAGSGTDHPYPKSIAAGDLDGDGDPDLAISSYSGSSVRIFLNNGDGTFAPHVDYASVQSSQSLAIGDVNNDGKLDLVLAAANEGGISVHLNQGNAVFSQHTEYTIIGYLYAPQSVALADLDGDGFLDAAYSTSNGAPGLTGYFHNNGDGTFALAMVQDVPQFGKAVACGDLNGDGRPDLAIGDSTGTISDDLMVFFNLGGGRFGTKLDFSITDWTESNALGDFDGDGRLDVLAVSFVENGGVNTFIYNQGGGAFAVDARLTNCGPQPGVVAADFDGDGLSDFATTCDNYQIRVNINRGGGTFTETGYIVGPDPPVDVGAWSIAADDLDGDGRPDLIVGDSLSQKVAVLRNHGDGTFEPYVAYDAGSFPFRLAVADMDGDGFKDIVADEQNANRVRIFYGKGKALFGPSSDYAIGATAFGANVGDVDADGLPDIVVAQPDSANTLGVLKNLGARTFDSEKYFPIGGVDARTPSVYDIDRDGHADAVFIGPNIVSVALNDGQGNFLRRMDWPTSENPDWISIGDIDADGRPDLVVTNFYGITSIYFSSCW